MKHLSIIKIISFLKNNIFNKTKKNKKWNKNNNKYLKKIRSMKN